MTASNIARVAGNAIFTKLDADLGAIPVGDGRAPADAGDLYAIVDHMDGTVRGDLDDGDTYVRVVVQVRSVGLDREGAQYVQDLVRQSLLDRTLTVVGATVMHTVHEIGGRVFPDDDADPTSRMVAIDRIAFHLDTRS